MDLMAFLIIAFGLIIIPGPNVIVIVSTSIVHGKIRGLQAVAGTSCAMIVQLFVAVLGTTWFITAVSDGLNWLKWFGVMFLVFMVIKQLRVSLGGSSQSSLSSVGSFQRGFWVSLTNPKTILFFGAFLPQFVSVQQPYLPHVAVLSVLFWLMAVVLDSMYALLSGQLAILAKSNPNSRFAGILSGSLFIGAGAALAAVGRE